MLNKPQLSAIAGFKITKEEPILTFYKEGWICLYTGAIAIRIKTNMEIPIDCQIPLVEVRKLNELLSIELLNDKILLNNVLQVPFDEPRYKIASMRVFNDNESNAQCSDYDPDLLQLIGRISKAFAATKFYHIQQYGFDAGIVDISDDVRVVIMLVKIGRKDGSNT